jgi:outer membrane lipase/esterase
MRIRSLSGAICAALVFSASASASQFTQVVSFGDSLSDAGNISIASGSPVITRFTTNPGHTAVEDIASHYGFTLLPSLAGGTDYAWGGAQSAINVPEGPLTIPSTATQIGQYLASTGGKANPNALYTLWIGGNDILNANPNPALAPTSVTIAALNEVGQIKALQAAGAKTIVVFNLPDLGLTPAAQSEGPAGVSGANQLSILYNGALNGGIKQLGKGIVQLDTFDLIHELVADPGKYGFTNVTVPACTTPSSISCTPATLVAPNADKTFLFADGIHPTTAAHAALAEYAVSVLNAPQQISLLGESALASNEAQARTLRNEMLSDNFGSETRVFTAVDYGQQTFKTGSTSPNTDSNNVNLTVGVDVRTSDNLSVGVALGVSQNNADVDGGGGFRMQDLAASGYAIYHAGGGYFGGYGSFGQLSYNGIARSFDIGAARRNESGDTDGSHLGAALTGGWWFGNDALKTGPFATAQYEDIKVNGYNEGGSDSTAMFFGKQKIQSLIGTVGWRLQGNWQWSNTMLHPYAELAWNHDDRADPRMVTAGLNALSGEFTLQGFTPDKTWGSADLGLMAQFSPNLSGWVGFNGRIGDDSQKLNSVNIGMKLGF